MESITVDIKRVNRRIHRAIYNKCRDFDVDITPVQGRLLMFIYEHSNVTATDILEDLDSINKSTLSEILNCMERNDLIQRRGATEDSRKKIIILTSKGESLVLLLKEEYSLINSVALKDVSLEEQKIFKEVLEKIGRNMDNL